MGKFFSVRKLRLRATTMGLRVLSLCLLLVGLLFYSVLLSSTVLLAQDAFPWTGTVVSGANLRSGPGTNFDRVGSAAAGQAVTVVAANGDGSWYRLQSGSWIAAFLVERSGGAPTAQSVAPAATQSALPAGTTAARVTRVVDGDTIDVLLNDQTLRVRYILMNTPETGQPFGAEATAKNRELVEGKTVYLEKDVSETDRFDRLLRYVYLADGTMVNRELVRLGFAQVSTFPPDVKYETQMRAAQQEALAAGRGLWAEQLAPAAPSAPAGAAASGNANLRGGPGTNFPVVGSVSSGQALDVVGRTQAGDWYQLRSGAWIAAFLVSGATAVPVAQNVPSAPVVSAPASSAAPAAAPAAVQQAAPAARGNCDPSYPDVCIPPGPDLDCGEIPFRRFRVIGADPHRFDGDNDGIGCER